MIAAWRYVGCTPVRWRRPALDADIAVVEYREGGAPEGSATKIPGSAKYADISLKRVKARADNAFWRWIATVLGAALGGPPVERRDLRISLLDGSRQPVMTWRVRNAFPVSLRRPHLDATANEIAIEKLILAHEGFQIETV